MSTVMITLAQNMAVVTGASRGIGRSIADGLAKDASGGFRL